jgi:hypothetical protein
MVKQEGSIKKQTRLSVKDSLVLIHLPLIYLLFVCVPGSFTIYSINGLKCSCFKGLSNHPTKRSDVPFTGLTNQLINQKR